MERLTKKETDDYTGKPIKGRYFVYNRYGNMNSNSIINKLGQLEDIEEELGIDLTTLFKALKNGVWLRNGKNIEHHKVFLCEQGEVFALGYGWHYKYGLQGWCLLTKQYKAQWALTKEELL